MKKRNLNRSQLFNIVLILALILLGFFTIESCDKNKKLAEDFENALNYIDTVMFYKSANNGLIAYNNTLNIQLSSLSKINKELSNELKEMKIKKPQTVTKTITKVEVKEVHIPYEVKLPCDTFEVPIKFNDGWIAIGGISNNNGISLDSIVLTNDVTIAIGEKDNGFFKRNESIVAIKSDNPYFNTTSIQSYIFQPKEPFYDKLWFKGSIFVTGFLLGSRL